MFLENVGGPVAALALNKNTSQVAVAGRSVFKIYNVTEKGFEIVLSLRSVKNNFTSCNDVAWNQVDENILASATPSGAIVTWNLNKPGFSKLDIVYQDHKRTVNKIDFHSNDASLLISGSIDTIKVFDLRQNEAVITYAGLSEPVRDLQFSPHKSNIFIAVQDNGYMQLYDIRKKDKFEMCFPGHNGPVFACDWHPEQTDLVATAGRDMSIKVWSLASSSPAMQHCIPTMESVSKVRWCYGNNNLISSCSLKRDFSINIWDVHRPYIAAARFTDPYEITTGMAWRQDVSNLVAVSSNGNLYQLPMIDAYRPLDHANPVGMAINPDGDIALALGDGLFRGSANQLGGNDLMSSPALNSSLSSRPSVSGTPQQSSLPSKLAHQGSHNRIRQSVTRRSQDSALRPRISSRSQLDVYKCTEMNWFVKTAQEYQLSDRPLAELCDHNAEVCAKLRRFQICQTWKILKLFYANISSTIPGANSTSQGVNPTPVSNRTMLPVGDDSSISNPTPVNTEFPYPSKSIASRSTLTQSILISPWTESLLDTTSIAGSEQSNASSNEWLSHETLSYEAFQTKHELFGPVERLIEHKLDESASSSSSSNHEDDFTNQQGSNNKTMSLVIDNHSDLKISNFVNTNAYHMKFYEIIADVIADVLKYHVDNSDVQSAVSILIVLGDRIKNIVNERIPEVDRESWYHSYIDLLSKFQLWNVMAQVINLSPLTNINSINQTSTTIYAACGSCGKPLNGKVGWICDRCRTKPSECSVCHGVITGLMAWCQGCYHGGHLIHMSQWYSENDYCPTGCGHMCELSQWR